MKRYYREDNGDIYDRETGKTIEVLREQQSDLGYGYIINEDKYISKDNIEEER